MKSMTKKVESTGEVCVKFTEEEMQQLKLEPGTKFSITENEDGQIILTPFVSLEVDISDWSREVLEFLVSASCKNDISINEVMQQVLEKYLEV